MEHQIALDQKLAKYKITRERYKEQFIALCGAGFTEQQANRLILKFFSNNRVLAVLNNHESLQMAPYSLTREQLVKIAEPSGGSKNIEAVKIAFMELRALKFSPDQIVRIAGNIGGSKNIKEVMSSFNELRLIHFSLEQIVQIVGHGSGSKNLEAVKMTFTELKELQFSHAQLN